MAKLLTALRMFITFIFGVLIGGIGMVFLITSGYGIGDFVVSGTPQVKELRQGLARVETQRDNMTRRLEGLGSVLQQVEKRYDELGRRFDSLELTLRREAQATHRPAANPAVRPGTAPEQ